jgi:glutamyl-tRNA synthetase
MLAQDLQKRLFKRGVSAELLESSGINLGTVIGLLAERSQTLEELADHALMFYAPNAPSQEDAAKHFNEVASTALVSLKMRLIDCDWNASDISAAIKEVVGAAGLKMPQLAIPVRLKVKSTNPSD